MSLPFALHIIFVVCNWIPVTLTYSFLLGRGRILNWGPIGIGLFAAYSVFITLSMTDSYLIAIVTGIVSVALISSFYAWLALRLPGEAFGVLSIAVHLALLDLVLTWTSFTNGAMGIARIPRLPYMESQEAITLVAVIVALLWIAFMLWLDKSSLARRLSALGEQESHALSLGISRIRAFLLAFLILGAGFLTESILYTQYLHLLYPTDFQFPAFIFLLMIVVAGKPGNMYGTLLATIALVFLREAIRFLPLAPESIGPMRLILFGFILIGAVYWRRDSLFPVQRSV